MAGQTTRQDDCYLSAAAEYGPALERLARAYEADADLRRDLAQEIHAALWRSFAQYDARCSMRTWVYRVAHNVGATHILRRRRYGARAFVDLDHAGDLASGDNPEAAFADSQALERLMALIQTLHPPDRQLMLLYLEDLDAVAISEITGLKAGTVATKIHRIKALLAKRFQQRGPHDD
jgi:RNA polymerase sigma-70 factor (ECF subfamily)